MSRIKTGFVAGLITVTTTTLLNLVCRAIGLLGENMDLKRLGSFLIDPVRNPAVALLLGLVIHVAAGTVLGTLYAVLVRSYRVVTGMLFMLAFWLLVMLVVAPLMKQGILGLQQGLSLPIATFALHMVFGAILGWIAGKMGVPSRRRA